MWGWSGSGGDAPREYMSGLRPLGAGVGVVLGRCPRLVYVGPLALWQAKNAGRGLRRWLSGLWW